MNVQMTYAGFWKRFAALMIDAILISIPSGFIAGAFGGAFGARMTDDISALVGSQLMAMAMSIVISWLYFSAMESSSLQGTVGKLAIGIKVTDLKGNRITFGRATGRFVGRILSSMIFGIGFLMVAVTKRKQGLHDLMADCLVVDRNAFVAATHRPPSELFSSPSAPAHAPVAVTSLSAQSGNAPQTDSQGQAVVCKCGTPSLPQARFCVSCGNPMTWPCEECKTENVQSACFCQKCGLNHDRLVKWQSQMVAIEKAIALGSFQDARKAMRQLPSVSRPLRCEAELLEKATSCDKRIRELASSLLSQSLEAARSSNQVSYWVLVKQYASIMTEECDAGTLKHASTEADRNIMLCNIQSAATRQSQRHVLCERYLKMFGDAPAYIGFYCGTVSGWLQKSREEASAKARFRKQVVATTIALFLFWTIVTTGYTTRVYWQAHWFDDPSAQYQLGRIYQDGNWLINKDSAIAVSWYRKAAEQANADAEAALGYMYFEGLGAAKDYAQSVEWYRKAVKQGNPRGQYNLGLMYLCGDGLAKYETMGVGLIRKAAEQGASYAQCSMGNIYMWGLGVSKDEAQGLSWYQKAAEQGDADGQNALGLAYQFGHGVNKDLATAAKWYLKAAEQGNAPAQNNLGTMYRDGIGVTRNYHRATKLFRKAAEQGLADAQVNLGIMCDNYQGVDYRYNDYGPAGAIKWFQKAADQGNALGQNNLGIMYLNGQGVTSDVAEAVKWFRKSAQQGNVHGQRNLATLYRDGTALAKDLDQAEELYRKAADQGDAEAANGLKQVLAEKNKGRL